MTVHTARPTVQPLTLVEHAATAEHGGAHWWPLLALALGTAVLIYAMACVITPFARCRRCDGNGKVQRPGGRAWHLCRRCKGSGHRLRWGRHVTNYLHRTHEHSRRANAQRAHLKSARRPR